MIRASEHAADKDAKYEVVDRRAGDPVSTYANPEHACTTLGVEGPYDLEGTEQLQTTSADGCTLVDRMRSSQPIKRQSNDSRGAGDDRHRRTS